MVMMEGMDRGRTIRSSVPNSELPSMRAASRRLTGVAWKKVFIMIRFQVLTAVGRIMTQKLSSRWRDLMTR